MCISNTIAILSSIRKWERSTTTSAFTTTTRARCFLMCFVLRLTCRSWSFEIWSLSWYAMTLELDSFISIKTFWRQKLSTKSTLTSRYWYFEFLCIRKTTRAIENEEEICHVFSSNDNISFDRHSSWRSTSLKDSFSSTSTLTFVLVRSSLMINCMWQCREWRRRRIFASLFLMNRLHRHAEYAMCNENKCY